jgi:hypothetical protein
MEEKMIYIIDTYNVIQRKNANWFKLGREEMFVDPNTKPGNNNLHSLDLHDSKRYSEPS